MKIAHVLNMANNGYHIVKALREEGVDAELIIRPTDFAMGLPMWEEVEVQMDPYNPDFEKLISIWELPPWIKVWGKDCGNKTQLYTSLYKLTDPYDLLHLHPPTPIYLQFKKQPYVIHEAGWIREFIKDGPSHKLGRRGYRNADCVVWTNPDTYPLLHILKCKNLKFIPFIVPPDKYKPLNIQQSEDPLFFHPTRQVWDVKGNHRLFKAFAQFINEGNKATLRCVDWGWKEDSEKAKTLVKTLGIEEQVEWVFPYTKPDLIKVYSECTAVFDQFTLGSGGTICYEAMSCSCPVAIYLDHWNLKCFGEMPPILNAYTVNEIKEAMILLTDPKVRMEMGEQGRRFTLKHNSPKAIAHDLINLYKEILH